MKKRRKRNNFDYEGEDQASEFPAEILIVN